LLAGGEVEVGGLGLAVASQRALGQYRTEAAGRFEVTSRSYSRRPGGQIGGTGLQVVQVFAEHHVVNSVAAIIAENADKVIDVCGT